MITRIALIVVAIAALAGCATGPYDTSTVRTEVRVTTGYHYPIHNGYVQFYSYTYPPHWYTGPYYRSRVYRYQPYYYAPPPQWTNPQERSYPRRFQRHEHPRKRHD